MFKELGYKYEYNKEDNTIEYWKNIDGINYEIDFVLDIKQFRILHEHEITIKELQAINKQVKELWGESNE